MPYYLLERLRGAQTGLTFDGRDEIDKLEILKAEQMVQADIPPMVHVDGQWRYAGPGIFIALTATGRAAIAHCRTTRS